MFSDGCRVFDLINVFALLRFGFERYNYNTLDKVSAWEAHQDYIRAVAVHPTQPFLLSSSDDMLIKLWDWDKVFCVESKHVFVLIFLFRTGPARVCLRDILTTSCRFASTQRFVCVGFLDFRLS